jgi:phenylpropionate dioxygenase-like ring-hydroxylating dioxygenase large terminal subunit
VTTHMRATSDGDRREMVRALIASQRPRHSLDQPFYGDPELFDLDRELLVEHHWQFAGLECEVPDPGCFITVEIGRSSIIICRDRDGRLRAFFNSCRHRGSIVCDAQRGNRSHFSCPYHHWRYDLTGRLVHAPNMGDDLDKAAHGLKAVHIAVIGGVIFVSLADDPPDLSAFQAALAPALAPHQLTAARVVKEIVLTERANWKLVWENARECDHCVGGHPELMKTLQLFNLEDPWSDPYIRAFWERCEASGLPSMTQQGHGFRVGRVPLQPGQLSITLDGKPAAARRLGDWPEPDIGSLRWSRYPSVFSHVHADYAIFVQIMPVGPQETKVTCKWVVHAAAVEGQDYDLDRLVEVWRVTNEQDQRFCERNQRGVNSKGYQPGPYAQPSEHGVWTFVDWYCTEMERALRP